MQAIKDETIPEGKWEFDASVAVAFEDMLARSIPQYDVMRQACFDIGKRYQQRKTDIVDLGCSRGEALLTFVDQFGAQNRFVGIDVSEPMLEAARERYQGLINAGVVSIRNFDLRNGYPDVFASVTLCVLTLQFTPIEHRLRILRDIYEHTAPGGALVFVEKVIGSCADIDSLMVDLYYDLKRTNGYTEEQIQRKRLSLEGALVPVTAKWNEELLHMTGFRQVDCFWRWMNFAGWVAVK